MVPQLGGRPRGLELRSNASGGKLMHLKGYCVDHRLLRIGSEFSRSGETRQDNDLVALRSASVCAGFDAKFDGLGLGSEKGRESRTPPMCNLYSLTKGQTAIRDWFRAK